MKKWLFLLVLLLCGTLSGCGLIESLLSEKDPGDKETDDPPPTIIEDIKE